MGVEGALNLETRRRIYEYVRAHPGAYMREIGRDLSIPMGTLEYHLHYLVRAGHLVTREDRRYTRYFVSEGMGRRDRDLLAILRQNVPRRIALLLLETPGLTHGELLSHFSLSPSTLSFHLKKLVERGVARVVVEGRERRYFLEERDLVLSVLIRYQPTFLDEVLDRFIEVWTGLDPTPSSSFPKGERPTPPSKVAESPKEIPKGTKEKEEPGANLSPSGLCNFYG